MAKLNYLPSVLNCPHTTGNSLCIERSLKQIKELIESIRPMSVNKVDMINTSLDDIEIMLEHIDHGE